MPKAAERALKAEAKKKGLSGKRAAAYVYGGLRNTGWKPKREKPARGEKRATAPQKRATRGQRRSYGKR